MNRSDTIGKLAEALSKAQGAIEGAKKDKANPFFKSKYADLASVWDACREPLSANGLSVVQLPELSEAHVKLTTVLMHSSGESLSAELTAPLKEATAQAIGSLITYLRRYSLAAIVGVAPDEDDDGNAASGRAAPKNGNGHGKPFTSSVQSIPPPPPAPSPVPPEEQAAVSLLESLEAIGEFVSAEEKAGWQEKHRVKVNELPAYLKKDVVEKFTKMPVKA